MCVAMSRNDRQVALGFGDTVRLYAFIDNTLEYQRSLDIYAAGSGRPATFKRQIMSFALDGQKLTVATHEPDDNIEIRTWNCSQVPSQRICNKVKANTSVSKLLCNFWAFNPFHCTRLMLTPV